jgi:hypothetical protein
MNTQEREERRAELGIVELAERDLTTETTEWERSRFWSAVGFPIWCAIGLVVIVLVVVGLCFTIWVMVT